MWELVTRTNAVLSYPCVSNSCMVETPFSCLKVLNPGCHYYSINYTEKLKAVCALWKTKFHKVLMGNQKVMSILKNRPFKKNHWIIPVNLLQCPGCENAVLVPHQPLLHECTSQIQNWSQAAVKGPQLAHCHERQTDGHLHSIKKGSSREQSLGWLHPTAWIRLQSNLWARKPRHPPR